VTKMSDDKRIEMSIQFPIFNCLLRPAATVFHFYLLSVTTLVLEYQGPNLSLKLYHMFHIFSLVEYIFHLLDRIIEMFGVRTRPVFLLKAHVTVHILIHKGKFFFFL